MGDTGSGGSSFNPNAFGGKLGEKLNYYLDTPLRFGEPLYAGMGGTTKSGYDQMRDIISGPAGQGLERSYNYTSNLIANNGYAPRSTPMTPQARTPGRSDPMPPSAEMVANGFYDQPQTPQAGGPSLTEQALMRSAAGGNLGGMDPNFQALQDRTAASMTGDITSALGSFGRGGASNLMADAIAENVGGMRLQSNENERKYQDALQRGDIAAIEGIRQQSVNNALTAGDRLGSRFGDLMLPGQTLTGIGGAEDADRQGRLLDRYDTWKRTETPGYNQLLEILNAFNGSGNTPGMKEETPWYLSLLGGGLDLAGRFF